MTMTEKLQRVQASPWFDLTHKIITIVILPWAVWVTNSIYESKRLAVTNITRQDLQSFEDKMEAKLDRLGEKVEAMHHEITREFIRKDELKFNGRP